MSTSPSSQPLERRPSAVDLFCTQTYPTAEKEARQGRALASTLGVVCLTLLLSLGVTVWWAQAIEKERDALFQELSSERAERMRATLAVKDVEMSGAMLTLDTQVRRDMVEEQLLLQKQRLVELEKLAEQVEREKLVAADCVTPRSILTAAGL